MVYMQIKAKMPVKPCPFCGSKPIVYMLDDKTHYGVICWECHMAHTSGQDHSKEEAIEIWNKRN